MIEKEDFKIGWVHEFTSNGGSKSNYLVKKIHDNGNEVKILLWESDGCGELGWFSLRTTFQNKYSKVLPVKKFSYRGPVFGQDEYLERMGIKEK